MKKFILGALALVVTAFSIFPVYWMVQTSFQPNNEIIGSEVNFWPQNFTLRNYETVLFDTTRSQFMPALGNSVVVTVSTVIIALVLIFKTQLTTLVNDIFEKITSESAGI